MRVMVTGGSGFIGAHTVARLLADGHRVRLLARTPSRLTDNLSALGVVDGIDDVVVGDMVDEAAVRAAVRGCDAVVHAAAVVAPLDRRGAARTVEHNVRGTQFVVQAATQAGCSHVVYVSSVAALFSPGLALLHADCPPAVTAASPYTRSKALAEQWVRGQQAAGAPVTSIYPGGVMGPAAGDAFGESAQGVVATLRPGFVPLKDGIWPVVDVRDVAAVIAAALTKAVPPARYVCGGRQLTMTDVAVVLREVTGRRIPVLPVPGAVYRGLGRVVDQVRRLVPFDTVFTAEAMDLLTLAVPTDDRAVHDELGIAYRDAVDTMHAAVLSLYRCGRLSSREAGRVAATPPSPL